MYSKLLLVLLPVAVLAADDQSAPPPEWSKKPVSSWSEDDAKQVLTDSPWAKETTPGISRRDDNSGYANRGGPGRRGGIGIGIPGIGFPGGGGGYPGGRRGGYGGYPNQYPQNGPAQSGRDQAVPKLTIRWESALPVREAELKTRDANAPTLEDEDHYALAVYGLPASVANGDLKKIADEAKKKAVLTRDGKKDIKASSVEVLRKEDGPVVLFLFALPKKDAITKEDRRVEFDAQITNYSLTQSFYLEDMTYQGKTEL